MHNELDEAEGIIERGEILLARNRIADSIAEFEHALTVGRRLGAALVEMEAQDGLGRSMLASGDAESASGHLALALDLAESMDHAHGVVSAHCGLGAVAVHRGDTATAARHYRVAIGLGHVLRPSEAEDLGELVDNLARTSRL